MGGVRGQASDIEIHANEIIRLKQVLTDILVKHTGQEAERVRQDCDRDHFMTAEQAQAYGIIDQVVQQREDEE